MPAVTSKQLRAKHPINRKAPVAAVAFQWRAVQDKVNARPPVTASLRVGEKNKLLAEVGMALFGTEEQPYIWAVYRKNNASPDASGYASDEATAMLRATMHILNNWSRLV